MDANQSHFFSFQIGRIFFPTFQSVPNTFKTRSGLPARQFQRNEVFSFVQAQNFYWTKGSDTKMRRNDFANWNFEKAGWVCKFVACGNVAFLRVGGGNHSADRLNNKYCINTAYRPIHTYIVALHTRQIQIGKPFGLRRTEPTFFSLSLFLYLRVWGSRNSSPSHSVRCYRLDEILLYVFGDMLTIGCASLTHISGFNHPSSWPNR